MTVVSECGVAGKGDERSASDAEGIEDLRGCVTPNPGV